jgi:F-type H+-transporting ATPase subunit delta
MIEPRIVRRYATALFRAANKAGIIDQVESDLGLVSYTIESSPRLAKVLRSPQIPRDVKRDILRAIFEGKVHEVTLSYLFLLVDKRREEAMTATEAVFVELANEARGIVVVDVTSAIELTRQEENRLREKLSVRTGKRVELVVHIDPSVIGGMIVKIGDTLIDGSIRGQLIALKEKMIG